MKVNEIYQGHSLEVLKTFPDESIDMCITSPPYWGLRDYGNSDQIGLEPNFEDYINNLCNIFDEVKRVLKPSGTCWVNLGDTYNNSSIPGNGDPTIKKRNLGNTKQPTRKKNAIENKCLLQIPARFSIEMINRGWILRNEIIWHKPNCMPSSASDRFTVDFEKLFFFVKNKKYYFKQQLEDLKESTIQRLGQDIDNQNGSSRTLKTNGNMKCVGNINGKNKRTTWTISPAQFSEAHFAVYPEELIETPINAGCPEGGIVLDPFFGSGTTGIVAKKNYKNWIGIELNPEYIEMAEKRINDTLVNKRLFKEKG